MNWTELLQTELFYELQYIRTKLNYFLTELHYFLTELQYSWTELHKFLT